MTPTPDQSRELRGLVYQRWMKSAVDLAGAIESRGIPVVVLKGPVLAERIYDDPSARSYSDIDLMVRRHDVAAAGRVLEGLGYALSLGGLTGAENRALEFNTLYLREGSPPVEIAFRFTDMPGAALESGAFVARRQPYRTEAGALVHTLDPEDEFLFLCTHGSRHHFEDPKWLLDLRLFLARYPALRWDTVSARARELRLQTAVWVACRTLCQDAGFQVPGGGPRVAPGWLMRRNWPGIVPAVSSFECYRRLDWGARDAFYEAALCDRISAAIFYLARRAFRFCRRELIRRASGRPAPEPSPAPSTEKRSGALSLTDEALVCASPEQVSCRRNDDAAVLNLKTGACYGLDPVGAFLWSLIAQPRPVSFLVDQTQRHFEVGAVQCRRDVLSLLDKLSKEGLIEIRG